MIDNIKEVKYPVKIGFVDGSGQDEFYITDKNDKAIICGQGDCCMAGGIRELNVALAIVETLNEKKPKIILNK